MYKSILFALGLFAAAVSAMPTPQDGEGGCEPTPPPPCESEPLGTVESSCTHGDYSCIGDDSAVCNWGQWVITPCGQGMRCLPYDYECVPENDWDYWYSRVAPSSST